MPENQRRHRKAFYRGENAPGLGGYSRSWIQQESTFWRRSLWERAGGSVDASLQYAADFELWRRFFRHADLYAVQSPIGGFRKHPAQNTHGGMERYCAEAKDALRRHGGRPHGRMQRYVRWALRALVGKRPLS